MRKPGPKTNNEIREGNMISWIMVTWSLSNYWWIKNRNNWTNEMDCVVRRLSNCLMIFMIWYGMTAHGKNHRVFSLYQQSGYYFTRAQLPGAADCAVSHVTVRDCRECRTLRPFHSIVNCLLFVVKKAYVIIVKSIFLANWYGRIHSLIQGHQGILWNCRHLGH